MLIINISISKIILKYFLKRCNCSIARSEAFVLQRTLIVFRNTCSSNHGSLLFWNKRDFVRRQIAVDVANSQAPEVAEDEDSHS